MLKLINVLRSTLCRNLRKIAANFCLCSKFDQILVSSYDAILLGFLKNSFCTNNVKTFV